MRLLIKIIDDSMKSDFWHTRWQENKIGFHQAEFNPLLSSYWSRLELNAAATVFVPLCGKSRDMLWLREQGHQVVGVELSELAVRCFFEENGIDYELHQYTGKNADLCLWQSEGIRIFSGDIFSLTCEDIGDIDAVYDRAALIALPQDMRKPYFEHLKSLTVSARTLLVTLEYPQSQMQGPPFSVSEAEVNALYSADYSLEKVFDEEIINQPENERFRHQGLTHMSEKVFLMSCKSGQA